MQAYKRLPLELRLKVLNHLRNPECDLVDAYWKGLEYFKRKDLLASLNRYNYFRKHRKPHWDDCWDRETGYSHAFDFSNDYSKELYLEYLRKGHWLPRSERLNGMKLRVDLFNMLDGNWWGYHGDIDNPEAIKHTIYDRLETKRDIERDFDVNISKDHGHPPFEFEKWSKCCAEGGGLPPTQRKRLKAPRKEGGGWDHTKAADNIKKMNEQQERLLIPRQWSRWRVEGDEAKATYQYWELQYPQVI